MQKNRLRSLWEKKERRYKTEFNHPGFDELRFHFNSMYSGVDSNSFVSLGYILGRRSNGRAIFKFWSFRVRELSDDVLRKIFILSKSRIVYVSQNTFTRPRRLSDFAFASKAFILDIDYYKVDKYRNLTPDQLLGVMKMDGMFDTIMPSYAIASGRGLSLVYIFKNPLPVGLNNRVRNLRTHIATQITKSFEKYGSDPSGRDLSRINKVPGSITVIQDQRRNEKSNDIKHMRLVSMISAEGYSTSSEFLSAVNQNIDEWQTFHEQNAFYESGNEINGTFPTSDKCIWAGEYIEKAYIINFDEIKDKQLHMHSVDEIAAFYLPNSKREYIEALKSEDQKKNKMKYEQRAKNKRTSTKKTRCKKTYQTLCSLRVTDIFNLSLERACHGRKQYRKSCLLIIAHLLAAQYNYHINQDLQSPLRRDAIREVLIRLNDTFIKPHAISQIDQIIDELVMKFDSNKDFSKRFYRYKNSSIIELLNIRRYEEKRMTVLICKLTCRARYKIRRLCKKQLRADAKERKVLYRLYDLRKYLRKGLIGRKIAELMGLSLSTINRLKKLLLSTYDSLIDSLDRKEISLKNNYKTLNDQKMTHSPNQLSFFDYLRTNNGQFADGNVSKKQNKGGLKHEILIS